MATRRIAVLELAVPATSYANAHGGDEIVFELACGLEEAAPWKDRRPAMATTLWAVWLKL
jgi:hypothetical protein